MSLYLSELKQKAEEPSYQSDRFKLGRLKQNMNFILFTAKFAF